MISSQKITILSSAMGFLLLLGYVYFASTMSSMGYAIDKKDKELLDIHNRESELIVELANLQNPDRLYAEGEDLGLVEIDVVSRYIDTRASALGRAD